MDGRAWSDIDKAIVLEVFNTIEEARESKDVYGDAVIVRADSVGDQLTNLEPLE